MKELYNEYEKSLDIQKKVIKINLIRLKQAQTDCNYREVRRLRSVLRLLYEEKNELEEKSNQLKGYIGKASF